MSQSSEDRSPWQLEVCVDRIDDAIAAASAGATRIEFNTGLQCSGLTPSIASCQWLAEHCPVPVLAMLRPHDSGFVYSRSEKWALRRDGELLLEQGIAGIVFGALTPDGGLDLDITADLIKMSGQRDFVFHRAFDQIEDQVTALMQLIDLGVKRVLTSGGKQTALEGCHRLNELMEVAAGRIEILPGAGLNSQTVPALLAQTGSRQVHGSFRSDAASSAGPDLRDIQATRKLLEDFHA